MNKEYQDKTGEVERELRAHGHGITPKRMSVVEVLGRHDGHLTGDEILAEVKSKHPSTDKTTVYRTLELLSSLGLVAVTDMGGGRLEYELVDHPHHHLVCERCNARVEIEDTFFDDLRSALATRYGFQTNLGHFALFGICPQCKSKTNV